MTTPTFSSGSGSHCGTETVKISTATPGAKIYYSIDGTTPTTWSSVYSGPITVSSSETLEASAGEAGYKARAAATASYTVNQQRNPRNESR